MAYRVSGEPPQGGSTVSPRKRGDRTLTRNALMAGAALGCVCLLSVGVALTGRDRGIGSVPDYVASHKALKLALVEPPQQAQFEPPTRLAAQPAPKAPVKTARLDAEIAAVPAPKPERVPLPHARPKETKQLMAAIPLPPTRPVDSEPTGSIGDQVTNSARDLAAALPAPREIAVMSYAPSEAAERNSTSKPQHPLAALASFHETDPISSSVMFEAKPLARAATGEHAAPTAKPGQQAVLALAKPEPVKLTKPPRALSIRDKLWGSPVRLASLTPMDTGRESDGGIPRAPYDRQTAVYVISDKKVYLPDGTVLEAHSGLGDKMDDPRFVHLRMRGATPPHVYELTMREALFHGVEAIRMTPMRGEEAIFGRAGILAHTYMLGPNGQSNGCVSFKDYDTFLEAFKDGKINRMAVLARLD